MKPLQAAPDAHWITLSGCGAVAVRPGVPALYGPRNGRRSRHGRRGGIPSRVGMARALFADRRRAIAMMPAKCEQKVTPIRRCTAQTGRARPGEPGELASEEAARTRVVLGSSAPSPPCPGRDRRSMVRLFPKGRLWSVTKSAWGKGTGGRLFGAAFHFIRVPRHRQESGAAGPFLPSERNGATRIAATPPATATMPR
jgi:hypothetical protein